MASWPGITYCRRVDWLKESVKFILGYILKNFENCVFKNFQNHHFQNVDVVSIVIGSERRRVLR
jgi:hypothetical protein